MIFYYDDFYTKETNMNNQGTHCKINNKCVYISVPKKFNNVQILRHFERNFY